MMEKKLLSISIVTLFFISLSAFSQTTLERRQLKVDSIHNNFGKEGNFVLKGKVENFKGKFFEFATTGYLDNVSASVIVNEDGTFEQQFPVTNQQQIYLYLNDDALTFSVNNNDTLTLKWDEKKFTETFSILGNKPERNLILQTEVELFRKFRKPFINLLEDLAKNRSAYTSDQKYNLINNQYNEKIKLILLAEKSRLDSSKYSLLFNNLIADEYYTYADILRSNGVKDKFLFINQNEDLKVPMIEYTDMNGKKATASRYGILTSKIASKSADERSFLNIPSYRKYLYNYLRLSRLIDMHSSLVPYRLGDQLPKTNFTQLHYYQGKASLNEGLLAEWYATKVIIDGFGSGEFSHVENVYNIFLNECKTPFFKDALTKHYNAVKTLKPGLQAPQFTLKDLNGKQVSLSDFKGKVVYIDFWGVGCGPCIWEFENSTPKSQEAYKDKNVVFLNICVDANEKEWKAGIKKHKVDGINLIAEGWTKNPVCKSYNVNGIPHYVLINSDGTIANNNAARPSELNRSLAKSELQMALEKGIALKN